MPSLDHTKHHTHHNPTAHNRPAHDQAHCDAKGRQEIEAAAFSPHAHHAHGGGPAIVSLQATLHCLTGCIIGEVVGVAIGVSFGLDPWITIILATTLAYVSGFTLGVLPVMKSQQIGFWSALRLIWLGEAISIGVMEIVMNAVDYSMGGMSVPSIAHWTFWQGFLFAVPAGFLAAWPVNWWLLSRHIKQKCH